MHEQEISNKENKENKENRDSKIKNKQTHKNNITLKNKLLNWFYHRSIVVLTALIGGFLTLFVTFVHCLITYILTSTILIEDIIKPLCYGILLIPFVTYFFAQVFAEFEEARLELLQKERQEQELQNKLEEKIIDIERQRNRNLMLRQDQERLRGTLRNEINQKNAAQNLLEEKASFLAAVVGLTPDIVIYRDITGKIIDCNANLLTFLSLDMKDQLDELLEQDKELAEILARNDVDIIQHKMDVTYQATIKSKAYQFRKRPAFNSHGELIGIMCYGQDITILKKEQDLIEETSKQKSNFISTLSHELRTPLNGIVGLSDLLLQSGHFKDEDMSHLKAINVSAVTLGCIFNDVIDLNKFDRQTFKVSEEIIVWGDFIESLATLASHMTEQKKLTFKATTTGVARIAYKTDPIRLRQILWNLISNAVKFTKEGSIRFDINYGAITDRGTQEVVINIIDTGIGIPETELENIFKLYYQVAGTKQATGTGIGLFVIKKLTEALGGSITVKSVIEKGSTFTLKFDLKIVEEAELKLLNQKQTQSSEDAITLNQNLQILLVEDVDLNILVAKSMLEKLGHTVYVAKTGADALRIAIEKRSELDLLLLDMQLPDMTGFDIADKLTLEECYKTPMLAITANVITDKSEYLKHNILGVINKPITASKLQEQLLEINNLK